MTLLRAVLLWCCLAPAFAAAAPQAASVKPNGTIVFDAATGGVTRISIQGDDRIKEMVATDSNFEPKSNPDTGDVFLRFIGKGRAPSEDGFIVTEKGFTINYTLRPKATASETVLIALQVPKPVVTEEVSARGLGAVTAGGGYVETLTAFLREVMVAHVDGRKPPAKRSGSLVANMRSGAFRARVLVVTAPRNGAPIRPQGFYRSGVVSVLVDRPTPGPGQRSFVVVVEQRS